MKEEYFCTVISMATQENKMFSCMGATISKNLKNAEFFL